MVIQYWLNGKKITDDIAAGMILYDCLRRQGCYSVKCGCETANCGLCTVWLDERPVLSCSIPALRVEGKKIVTLEGLQAEAREFGRFMAEEGADQCGFCNPGFVMNVLAMVRELEQPTDEAINAYLAGNLCRCTGYISHMRAIRKYLDFKQAQKGEA